jgi:hypothetical protein
MTERFDNGITISTSAGVPSSRPKAEKTNS